MLIAIIRKNGPGIFRLLPFTLLVFLLGMCLGLINSGDFSLGILYNSISNWRDLKAEMLLFMFLPPLLFVSAFEVEFHIFRRLTGQAVLLATAGVVINSGLLAAFSYVAFGYEWSWSEAFLFGSMFGATDPIAVVQLLKELGAPETLSVLIEAESLLNDGTGFVLFSVFLEQASGKAAYTAGEIFVRVLESASLGILIGVSMGFLSLWALQQIWDDSTVAVAITIVSVWGTFFIAESVHASGVIACVFLGLFFAAYQDGHIKHDVSTSLKHFWEKVEWLVNTVLFVFSGVIIADTISKAENGTYTLTARDIGNLVALFFMINLIRWISVVVLFPALRNLGYGLSWRKSLVLSYAGLRGAVGLIAALLVLQECSCPSDDSAQGTDGEPAIVCLLYTTQSRMIFHMAGIVFLTLAVNGTTTKFLLNYFELHKQPASAQSFFEKATVHVHDHMEYVLESLKRHPHYKDADWDTVWRHMPILSRQVYEERKRMGQPHERDSFSLLKAIDKINQSRFTGAHVQAVSESNPMADDSRSSASSKTVRSSASSHKSDMSIVTMPETPQSEKLREARHRFLSLVKASYRRQFIEGANKSWPTMQVLIEACSRCQDKSHYPLAEWKNHVAKYVGAQRFLGVPIPSCTDQIRARHLENAYNVASTFVRAHKSVVPQFKHFVHEATAGVVATVLEENHEMLQQAMAFTRKLESEFPEITATVKTNIAIQRLLTEMESYAHKLLDRAEIDEKDFETIVHGLDESRKRGHKLTVNYLQSKFQIMKNSSFMLEVRHDIVEQIMAKAVSSTYEPGEIIFDAGDPCDAILIVVKGKVRVEFESGVELEKTSGDALGTVEFVTRNDGSGTSKFGTHAQLAQCETHVEVMRIDFALISELVPEDENLEYNVFRDAGLFVLESLYPQFQYATFNLLKSVLPHIKIIRGEERNKNTSASIQNGTQLGGHRAHHVVTTTKPVLFHGGVIIPLSGIVSSLDGGHRIFGTPGINQAKKATASKVQRSSGSIDLLSSVVPHGPVSLSKGAVLMHISQEAVHTIDDFQAFERGVANEANPASRRAQLSVLHSTGSSKLWKSPIPGNSIIRTPKLGLLNDAATKANRSASVESFDSTQSL